MSERARAALEDYLSRSRPEFSRGDDRAVFLSNRGKPLSRKTAWKAFRALCVRAGIPGVHPHTLRHSFATHLMEGGAGIRDVQELLGHENIATTTIYTHTDTARLRKIHRQYHHERNDSPAAICAGAAGYHRYRLDNGKRASARRACPALACKTPGRTWPILPLARGNLATAPIRAPRGPGAFLSCVHGILRGDRARGVEAFRRAL